MNLPYENQNYQVFTVSELTKEIQRLLDDRFDFLWLEGEISNFSSPVSGHYYMVIKDEKSRIGTMVKYYNIQESLTTSKYSLDQEKTPIFYKFRGLDTPLIFRGETSEERLYSIEGASLMIDGLVKHFDLADIDFSVNYGISHADNVDGGAYPIKQGKWRNQYGSYSLTLLFALGNTNCLKLFSNGFTRNLDAEHPDLHLDIYSEKEKIFNYLLKVLRKREDAEDITQEVFLAFYHKMDTINPKAYKSYLFTTAYHKALNLIKKNKKKNDISFEFNKMEIYSEEPLVEKPNYNEIIKTALQKLPLKYATLLELQFFQKKSYKEIAEIMGTTVSSVDSKLVRAKKKLKQIVEISNKL